MRKLALMLVCLMCLGVSWALAEDVVLYTGSASASAGDANIAYVFTAHVGGEWDAGQMNPGCAFRVTYKGPENAVYLALSSHSGARQWARVNADEVIENASGTRTALFTCESILKAWGNQFARLDQLNVFSRTAERVTVMYFAYLPGEGDPYDTSDGRWSNKPDGGVAFIGDSICQNPIYSFGDWNTLLGRSDCVNFGIGGQTTEHCVRRIDELCGRGYRQVVFICGINELGRGDYETGIVANYDAMISALKADNPDIQAVIVSVLPTTEAFYYGMQNRIVRLNAVLEEYAAENENVAFVNCYDDFVDPARGYAKPELLSDGLHPNADGYAVMVRHLQEALVPEEDD